jgi:cytochrome c biogenesis protein CcdA
MWGLLVSTILTSAVDSLNPIALTQQFVLQGIVKKPKHIWYFIVSILLTNLVSGFLAYFGVITFVGNSFGMLINQYGQTLFVFELIIGIIFLVAACYLFRKIKIKMLKEQNQSYEIEIVHKIKSVSPISLAIIGVGSTISELPTALPYFAFFAILFSYQISFIQVTFILIVYNIIYILPNVILYFAYIKAQNKFDRLYKFIKKQVNWANIITPSIVALIGIFLTAHSLSLLLK